ncbi:hypothetical protein HZB00_04440 [Candidatus Woesearchaeota archaeon]|nr:hypothetical protein [Candidatus Woesearchaeota archaeon]
MILFCLLFSLFLIGCTPPELAFAPERNATVEPPEILTQLQMEQILFEQINQERHNRSISALLWDDRLAVIARDYSLDMAQRKYFDHISPDGVTQLQRLERGGFFAFRNSSENIFIISLVNQYGLDDDKKCISEIQYRTHRDLITRAFKIWKREEGSLSALLNPALARSGLGIATVDNETYYFTQLFIEPTSCGVKNLPCCRGFHNDISVGYCTPPASCGQDSICFVPKFYEPPEEPYQSTFSPQFKPDLLMCK